MNKKFRAQGIVEFALVLPIFLFMLLVFVDLGRAIITYSILSNAVREGTRYAIVHPTATSTDRTNVLNAVKNYAGGVDSSQITITPTWPTTSDHYVTLVATYPFQPITPGLILILGSTNAITLRAQSSALTAPLYWQ
jgi:Flp pilus assembly protein TadG